MKQLMPLEAQGKSDKSNVLTGLYRYLRLLVTTNLLQEGEGMCIGQK